VTKIAGHYSLAPDEVDTASDAPGQVTDEDDTALN